LLRDSSKRDTRLFFGTVTVVCCTEDKQRGLGYMELFQDVHRLPL